MKEWHILSNIANHLEMDTNIKTQQFFSPWNNSKIIYTPKFSCFNEKASQSYNDAKMTKI